MKITKIILIGFTILTIATAAYAQIQPAGVVYNSPKAQSVITIKSEIETTEQTIRRLAKEANFKWPEYLVRLAKCENPSMDPKNHNDKNNYPEWSIDRGQFMINNYWHSEVSDECAYNLECATKWTMNQINNGEQHEWVCDETAKTKK